MVAAGALALVAGCAAVAAGPRLGLLLLPLAAVSLSPDGVVSPHGAQLLVGAVRVAGGVLAGIGLGLLALTSPGVRRSAARELIADPLAGWPSPTRPAVVSAFVPVGLGLLLCLLYHLRVPVGINDAFAEDGLFEHLTVLGLVAASLVAARSGMIAARRAYRMVSLTAWGLALLFLTAAGEELSWGQRIFGWSTPDRLAQLNTLGETNLHNIVTPWFDLLYGAAAVTLICLTLAPIFRGAAGRRPTSTGLLLPHASLLGVTLLMAVNTLPPLQRYDELFEELAALLAVAWSARLHRRLGSLPDRTRPLLGGEGPDCRRPADHAP